MNKTKIPYIDYTWNPIAMRCTPCSPGCDHCWHLRMADRLIGNHKLGITDRMAYGGAGARLTNHINDPLHIKKPARIGVQFMGDLFHESMPIDMIGEIFEVIDQCPQHTFFLLSKRPERFEKVFNWLAMSDDAPCLANWPHQNIYLGITVCNQEEADKKIPVLLQIPGFKKWVSYEPALGPMKLKEWEFYRYQGEGKLPRLVRPQLSWITAGSETGPRARSADNEWFRSVARKCREAGVPYFQKQTTGPTPEDLRVREMPK